MDFITERSIDGLVLGVLYGLIAAAYSLAYGAGRSLLFTSGAIYLLGAAVSVCAIWAAAARGAASEPLAVLLSLIASIAVCGVAGGAINRVHQIPVAKHADFLPLIAAPGFFIIVTGLLLFATGLRLPQYVQPDFAPRFVLLIPGVLRVGIAWTKPVAVVVGAAALVSVFCLMRATSYGRAQRAVLQNRQMAEALGLDAGRINLLSVLIASAFAALAAWMTTIEGSFNINRSLLAAVIGLAAAMTGGLRSVRGAASVGFVAGLANGLWSAYFGRDYADVAVLAGLLFALMVVQPALTGRRPVEEV